MVVELAAGPPLRRDWGCYTHRIYAASTFGSRFETSSRSYCDTSHLTARPNVRIDNHAMILLSKNFGAPPIVPSRDGDEPLSSVQTSTLTQNYMERLGSTSKSR